MTETYTKIDTDTVRVTKTVDRNIKVSDVKRQIEMLEKQKSLIQTRIDVFTEQLVEFEKVGVSVISAGEIIK